MKLVIDMNLSADWTSSLHEAGLVAVHWRSVGPDTADDETIMAWARNNGAIILTRDLDFGSMLAREGGVSPSVIQLRIERVDARLHGPLVVDALARYRRHLEVGALITLEERQTRVRMLDDSFKS